MKQRGNCLQTQISLETCAFRRKLAKHKPNSNPNLALFIIRARPRVAYRRAESVRASPMNARQVLPPKDSGGPRQGGVGAWRVHRSNRHSQ